jgi:hypothetical protein
VLPVVRARELDGLERERLDLLMAELGATEATRATRASFWRGPLPGLLAHTFRPPLNRDVADGPRLLDEPKLVLATRLIEMRRPRRPRSTKAGQPR